MKHVYTDSRGGLHPVHLIIICIIIMLLAAFGWWLWQRNEPQPIEESAEETSIQVDSDEEPDEAAPEEEPATRIAVSESGGFEVMIPEAWLDTTCDGVDSLFVAPNDDLLGVCASEFGGLISITKTSGDRRYEETAFMARTDINDQSFLVTELDGMPATRAVYTQSEEPIVGPPIGTQYVSVVAFDGTDSYILTYTQYPDWGNYQLEFEEIVSSFSRD
ncbi:MAG: hypothetical protein U5K77_03700 [Candidatus Saccharibacteria bacterium]|nr:hypothetical protein [Candidatus Saccharibacteria bacterium]